MLTCLIFSFPWKSTGFLQIQVFIFDYNIKIRMFENLKFLCQPPRENHEVFF